MRPADDDEPSDSLEGGDGDLETGSNDTLLRAIARAPVLGAPPAWQGALGQRLADRFRLIRCIGRGGMGVVYEAEDEHLRERVALKTMRIYGPDALFRFKNEFRALADLHHPNLVRLGELFSDGDKWFFTMELLSGDDLLGHLVGNPDRIRPVFGQLLDGLEALHASGKVHQDIKPMNVRVTDEGRVVLLDFGLVRDVALEGPQDPAGARVGTPLYMAPEQAAEGQSGSPADLYAVGVMLYEALAGRPPAQGAFSEVARRRGQALPQPLDALASEIPADLEALAMDLLAAEPARRPSLLEVKARLSRNAPASLAVSSSGSIPFVGRGAELEALKLALAAAENEPLTVLVRGESGIGKSELLRQFALHIERERPETLVLRGRCYERESVPYNAFDGIVDALCRHLLREDRREALRLLPDAREVSALLRLFPVLERIPAFESPDRGRDSPDPVELRSLAFRALRRLFSGLRRTRPVVLSIDDLQWTDTDSLLLLDDLLQPPGGPALLLCASVRLEHRKLKLPGAVRWIELGGLPLEEASFLAMRLGRDDSQAHRIATESRGHPFFTTELAASSDALGPTMRLDDLLWSKASRMEAPQRRLLESVAVSGLPLAEGVAVDVAALDPSELGPCLAALRAGRLVRAVTGSGIEVYHDRVRETVLERLSPEQRRAHHLRLAGALERAGAGESAPQVLAHHFEAGGDAGRAALHAELAARRAHAALAFDEAAELFGAAIRLGNAVGRDVQQLHGSRARALAAAGRSAEAATAFLAAGDGASGQERLRHHQDAARNHLASGHLEEGRAVLQRVLEDIGGKWPKTQLEAVGLLVKHRVALRVRGLGFTLRPDDQIDADRLLRLDIHLAIALGLTAVDHLLGAAFHAAALRQALDLGERSRILTLLVNETINRSVPGVGARAAVHEVYGALEDLARTTGRPEARALLAHAELMICYFAGQLHEVAERGLETERLLLEAYDMPVRIIALNHARFMRLLALQHLGRFSDMTVVNEHIRDATRRGDRFAETVLRVGLAEFWLARGGRALLDEQMGQLSWKPQRTFHGMHNYDLWGRTALALYRDEAPALGDLAQELRAATLRAKITRIQSIRLRTECAHAKLALADRSHSGEAARVRLAARIARRLAGEGVALARVWALLLEAAIAARRGRVEEAVANLREAIRVAEAAGARGHVAAARWRLAEIVGGEAGATERLDAETYLHAEQVLEPARFVAMLAPGFPQR